MFTAGLIRRVAAALAAVALLSAAARPVLACEMGIGHHGEVPLASTEQAPPGAVDHGAHAHGGAHADPGAESGGEVPSPDASQCDHVVGCATMVVALAPALVVTPVLVVDAAPTSHHARVDAPAPALEPPPPKA